MQSLNLVTVRDNPPTTPVTRTSDYIFQLPGLNLLYNPTQVILYGELKTEPLWGRILIKFNHFLLTISSALNIIIYSYNERFPGQSKVESLKSSLYRISSSVQFLEYFARNTTISALETNNLRLNNSKVKYLILSEAPDCYKKNTWSRWWSQQCSLSGSVSSIKIKKIIFRFNYWIIKKD